MTKTSTGDHYPEISPTTIPTDQPWTTTTSYFNPYSQNVPTMYEKCEAISRLRDLLETKESWMDKELFDEIIEKIRFLVKSI